MKLLWNPSAHTSCLLALCLKIIFCPLFLLYLPHWEFMNFSPAMPNHHSRSASLICQSDAMSRRSQAGLRFIPADSLKSIIHMKSSREAFMWRTTGPSLRQWDSIRQLTTISKQWNFWELWPSFQGELRWSRVLLVRMRREKVLWGIFKSSNHFRNQCECCLWLRMTWRNLRRNDTEKERESETWGIEQSSGN